MDTGTVTVSNDVIMGILSAMNIAIFGPVFLLVIWKLRKKCKLAPAFAGALTFRDESGVLFYLKPCGRLHLNRRSLSRRL